MDGFIKRKPKRLLNRSNYFDPDTDKTHVTFESPDSFFSKSSKIQGYLSRIYYEFKHTSEVGGQSFFYTLTYNDAHVPRYKDVVCFDYNDLVYLLNGGFKKKLERVYGTQLKYFVGAELGDGKGSRGIDNNPHYHVIFFLTPKNDCKVPYSKIHPKEFRSLVKFYWQGFDEFKTGYHDYKTAKLGIAKEGDNIGLITDFRACAYCAKYVTKDVSLVKYTKYLQRELALEFSQDLYNQPSLFEGFLYDFIFPKYNIPSNCVLIDSPEDYKSVVWRFDYLQLYLQCCPNHSTRLLLTMNMQDITPFLACHGFISECDLMDDFKKYCDEKIQERVNVAVSEFRNRYSNKCRISQGVGLSALNELDSNYNIKLPDSNGWRITPICLYYYRKLFTDVVKDEKGNNIRVLNDLGLDFKVSCLPKKISSLANLAESYFRSLDQDLFSKITSSRLNCSVSKDFTYFLKYLTDETKLKSSCVRYAEYKLVYEDRFVSVQPCRHRPSGGFPPVDILSDYRRFLLPSYYQIDYSPFRLSYFLDSSNQDYLPYWAHPYFLEDIDFFRLLDLLCIYFRASRDKVSQEAFETQKHLRQFHGREKLITYFNHFKSHEN